MEWLNGWKVGYLVVLLMLTDQMSMCVAFREHVRFVAPTIEVDLGVAFIL